MRSRARLQGRCEALFDKPLAPPGHRPQGTAIDALGGLAHARPTRTNSRSSAFGRLAGRQLADHRNLSFSWLRADALRATLLLARTDQSDDELAPG